MLYVFVGVARGTGWQTLGACVNLGSYYVVGTPVAILLGFQAHLKAKGLWIGIVAGALVQSILLAIITCFTDWKKEVPFLTYFLTHYFSILFKKRNESTFKSLNSTYIAVKISANEFLCSI